MENMSPQELMAAFVAEMRTRSSYGAIVFDRDADELLLDLVAPTQPAVSVPVIPDFSVRVSPDRQQLIGLHIENVLTRAVVTHPWLLDLFDLIETDLATDAAVMRARRAVSSREKAGQLIPAHADELLAGVA